MCRMHHTIKLFFSINLHNVHIFLRVWMLCLKSNLLVEGGQVRKTQGPM